MPDREENYRKNIEDINSHTTSILYGVSQDFLNKNNIEINKIKDTIKRISVKNNYIVGDNPIEFLTKMAYNDKQNNVKSALEKIPKDNKGKVDVNKFINGMTLGQINEIYAEELDRISSYDDYRAIVRYIPQIAQGIKIWKDNIISPDDFTKDIFDIVYDDEKDEDLKDKVESNITNNIHERYNIENKVDEWITNTLTVGDEFIAVLKLEDEFNKMLEEGNDLSKGINILDESIQLNEDTVIISEQDSKLLEDIYLENNPKKENLNEKEQKEYEINKNNFIKEIKNEISSILNSNIKYSTNEATLLEDDMSIIQSMNKEIDKKNNKYAGSNDKVDKEFNLTAKGIIEKNNKDKFNGINNDNFVNGSYIKTLEPDRVIKIKIGEVVYGYFYIEVKGKNELIHPKNVYSALTLRQTVDLTSSDTSMIDDPKVRLVTDLFAKNIGKKIDKEFIADNREFKTILYELLKKDYIYNNNIQITYFEPKTIKHLMVEEGKDGYGVSVLKDIIFTAKLYLSVLITTLLTKISRSQEHRTFYIETGLSEDVEGIVNAFIRDTKTKDVKISDTQSIDSIFNTIGSCSNFYIPSVELADIKVF